MQTHQDKSGQVLQFCGLMIIAEKCCCFNTWSFNYSNTTKHDPDRISFFFLLRSKLEAKSTMALRIVFFVCLVGWLFFAFVQHLPTAGFSHVCSVLFFFLLLGLPESQGSKIYRTVIENRQRGRVAERYSMK